MNAHFMPPSDDTSPAGFRPGHTRAHARPVDAGAAPLALDCCATCRFYLPDRRGPGAGVASVLDRRAARADADPAGLCRRMPQSLPKAAAEWCGEFSRRPAG